MENFIANSFGSILSASHKTKQQYKQTHILHTFFLPSWALSLASSESPLTVKDTLSESLVRRSECDWSREGEG